MKKIRTKIQQIIKKKPEEMLENRDKSPKILEISGLFHHKVRIFPAKFK